MLSEKDETKNWHGRGYVLPFMLDGGVARGRFIRLGLEMQQIFDKRDYPLYIQQMICELAILGVSLIVDQKNADALTLQLTDGPLISMIVVEVNQDGQLRGCAQYDEKALTSFFEKNPMPRFDFVFENANFIFSTRFKYTTEIQQAILPVEGATLMECVDYFFTQSVQIPTIIKAFDRNTFIPTDFSDHQETSDVIDLQTGYCAKDQANFYAGGIFLQKMPFDYMDTSLFTNDEHLFETYQVLLSTLTSKEMLTPQFSHETILYRLFNQHEITVFPSKILSFQCRCARETLYSFFKTFPKNALQEMADADNDSIQATCHFCGQRYDFNLEDF